MSEIKQALYEKFGFDVPKISPSEQLKAAMLWYPNKRFYERASSKSGKKIISVYSENAVCPVYSHDEWYAENWSSPFIDYDPSLPFFDQFRKLQKIAPVVSLLSSLQENAEYCQDSEGLKNCYLVFDSLNCKDVYYSTRIYNSNNCTDCYWVMDGELLYDSVYMFNSYNCRYNFNCQKVADSAFLFNCRNTQNSFMSSNLRNKQYYVYNKQCTKEKYEEFLETVDFSNYAKILELKKYFREELVAKTPIPPGFFENCENVTGNYLKNSANVELVFESYEMKDSFDSFQCAKAVDVVGSFMCNDRVERCFQCVATGIESYETKNCVFVWHGSFMEYCYLCLNCNNCFGCIGLRNKQYHIFNKPYSKDEYAIKVRQIIQDMRNRGEYGQFFPAGLSPFNYEDTIAYDFFENRKTGAFMAEYEKRLGQAGEIVESAIQTCPVSGKKFKYIPQELQFYKKHGIPLPTVASPVRYRQRMELMDTGFENKEVRTVRGEILQTTFAHPENKIIVSRAEYEKALI